MQQKRNLDLIRLLLLELEGAEEVDLSEYPQDEINYNKYLIVDAGLATGQPLWGTGVDGKPGLIDAQLDWLTWQGQEFLAAARNPEVWRKATGEVARKGLDVSLEVLKALLTAYLKGQLGLP